MSTLIAVWGSPNSGKTTLTVKLGQFFSKQTDETVYTVFADDTTPALPIIFPSKKADDMFSLGVPLSKVNIETRDIVANTVIAKGYENLGFLGYTDGENRFSYAYSDEEKCEHFLNILKSMCEVVIVDCSSVPNTFSKAAMAMADKVVRVVSPELKSIGFFSSQLPLMGDPSYQRNNHIIVVSEPKSDVFLPSDDVRSYIGGKSSLKISYCRELQVQSANGELLDKIRDKKFNNQLRAVALELAK